MNRSFISLVLFFSFFGSHCHQAPAAGRNYEIGTIYTYDYTLGVELNEPGPYFNSTSSQPLEDEGSSSGYRTGSTVGYKVVSQVQVTPVWRNEPGGALLEVQLLKPQLQIKSRKAPSPEGFHDHTSELDSIQLNPLYIYWKNGAVQSTYSVNSDDISLVNIKKGIANLLQFQIGTEKVLVENSPIGVCNITYSRSNSRLLTKTINGQCQLQPGSDSKFLKTSHASPVLGSETESDIRVEITLTDEATFVEEAVVQENHVVRVTVRKEVGATINASQHFKLSGTSTGNTQLVKASTIDEAILEIGQVKGLKLISESLVPHPEKIPFCETTQCKPEDSLLKVMTPENMATSKMANAFIQMVSKFRDASMEEIKKILKGNPDILPQLLDACAATGSLNSHKAAMSLLDFSNADDITNPERYLLGLSLTTLPDQEIVNDLFQLSKTQKNEKLKESLILSTSALVHTVRIQTNNLDYGQAIESNFLENLSQCDFSTPECSQLYLRALKNLKSKSTVPILFKILESSNNSKTSVVAMKALHSFPDSYFDRKLHRPILINVIKQFGKNKYDSSTRTLGIDLILRNNPTKAEINDIIVNLLPRQEHAEVVTYLINRLDEFSDGNPKLKLYLEEIIAENSFKNYHYLSPRGLSTAFSRQFTSNPSGNSSFSNAIEMTGKILKRSSFDVYVRSQDEFIHPLSLGIFAGGLSAFTSDDNGDEKVEDEDDSEEATAGMELSLMGIQMRPIIFFVGKGELMGMVWSGAGSEKTTALQGNVLLQDEKKIIPLYSGLVADINIQGGLSFDLSGQITMSLWHRTANSLVENKAGLVLQSVIRVDTSFVRSRVDYTVASEAGLDFTSDINFYDGVLMCLKLTQPEFTIKQNIHKTERIPGSKHKLRKAKYKSIPVPGLTYALNKKNSELCGIMYKKDEL